MCLTCGCGRPADRHGDPRNITYADLADAAAAAGIGTGAAAANLAAAVESAHGATDPAALFAHTAGLALDPTTQHP